jgi:hypothetical protein
MPIFWTYPSQCIPAMVEDFNVHFFVRLFLCLQHDLWSEFTVNETLSIKEVLQHNPAIALVQAEFSFRGYDLDFH